ncbi:hypothetical protein KOAAANKH_02554 [Brevundimonas sp. NIBR10]|uniref:DUF1376 domain-containing protein n=1 Tax=Brevundimonas sp. NIBR10 TaxID=3015997 RepID=UPI0022F14CCF|nr:DUF1376 domain-containing protein [Brevundimonas sp. NIBR10]WGM47672.1 hypothetical protein KOAAANKH_02554 [Brevundimonas sp. NIBR10]
MTQPLTPPDCDLTDFASMFFDVRRLLTSETWIEAAETPRLGHVLMSLWMESWHQRPAASLPDNDAVLARLAMCDLKTWRRLRNAALAGWVLCDDGRLYHPVVAEKALEAWERKVSYRGRTASARAAKQAKKTSPTGYVTDDVTGSVTVAETGPLTGLKGRGRGRIDSVSNETGADAPIDPNKRAWDDARAVLTGQGGMAKGQAASLFGKLLKDHGLEAKDMLPSLAKCIENQTQDPAAYLTKAASALSDRRSGGAPAPRPADEPESDATWRRRLDALRGPDRVWIESTWGPAPGRDGCRVPADLLEDGK